MARTKIVKFSAVNGLQAHKLREWLDKFGCIDKDDEYAMHHIHWLIEQCYYADSYQDDWRFGYNVRSRRLQYLTGNFLEPIIESWFDEGEDPDPKEEPEDDISALKV